MNETIAMVNSRRILLEGEAFTKKTAATLKNGKEQMTMVRGSNLKLPISKDTECLFAWR
jgi:hypothetical protein